MTRIAIPAALLLALGCVGTSTPSTGEGPEVVVPVTTCRGDEVGPPMLRRLTAAEVDATIRVALGLDATWTSPGLPPDPASATGFTNSEDRLRVTESWLARLDEVARAAASAAVSEPHRSRLAACASVGDRACAETTARALGRRLYRRALSATELARYVALFDALGGFDGFLRGAVHAMLISPNVVWRSELGAGEDERTLDGSEIATALAFGYTGAPPDEALLALGEAGGLATPEGRIDAVRALVLDGGVVRPRARARFLEFADGWLGLPALATLDRSAELYPAFEPAIRDAMGDEIRRFLEVTVLDERGDLESLLTSSATYASPALAAYYGMPMPDAEGRIERPPGMGVGLLAQGAFLTLQASAVSTSPTRRGHFVRSRMLCQPIPPPPPSVGPIPPPSPTRTTRERYESVHATEPFCAGCHQRMDPIGFALEGFDAAGRVRTHESGVPIDDSGALHATSLGTIRIDGEESLAHELAALPEVDACVATFEAVHLFGVGEEEARCLAESGRRVLDDGGSLLDAWIALAGSPQFATRAP